ncbi:hypothetical protein, partial [Enterococcus larvae]|uniref:hypothetical protein n=1 Tax=Enterococcus larvae TaxID=2794352 RepID=UPI003F2AE1EE
LKSEIRSSKVFLLIFEKWRRKEHALPLLEQYLFCFYTVYLTGSSSWMTGADAASNALEYATGNNSIA